MLTLVVVVAMVLVLAVAGLVVVFTAYTNRGQSTPAPWLGRAMDRAVSRLSYLHSEDVDRPTSFHEGERHRTPR